MPHDYSVESIIAFSEFYSPYSISICGVTRKSRVPGQCPMIFEKMDQK